MNNTKEVNGQMENQSCKYADITVNPKSMDFVVDEGWAFIPPYQNLLIGKDGTGRSPHWEISVYNVPWLRVTPWVGSVPGKVRIGCASIGMEAGIYEGVMTITSHVKIDTPEIPVTLTVRPKGAPGPGPGPDPEPDPTPPPPEPEPPSPEPTPPPSDPEPPPPDPEPPEEEQWWSKFLNWLMDLVRRIWRR